MATVGTPLAVIHSPPTLPDVPCAALAPRGGDRVGPFMTLRKAGASGARASFGLNQCRNTKLVNPACQLAMRALYGKIRHA